MRRPTRSHRRLAVMCYTFLCCLDRSTVRGQIFKTVVVDSDGDVGLHTSLVGGGPGFYIPESCADKLDANIGLYADYDVNRRIVLELGTDYHAIFDTDRQFRHIHAGVLVRF